MSKVEFIRKPGRGELDPRKKGSNYKIENIVTLEPKFFEAFLNSPLRDYDFIEDNIERMYIDKDGIWHCILITAEGYDFGILVQSEGYSYARYAASIPRNVRRVKKMNKTINFNEVRKLANQVSKGRPILGCMRIKEGKAYWTDGFYLITMEGYEDTPDMTIDLSDYSVKTQNYPEVERIIDKEFTKKEFKVEIHEGEILYLYERLDKNGNEFKTFIDNSIINQLKKLIQIKKFNLNISEIELNETNTMGRITVDPLTKIYFTLKRKSE